MDSTELLKSRLHLGTASFLIAALGCLGSTGAIAQDANTEEDDEIAVEEVVVTGSRIKRTGIDTIRPAIGVSAEVFDQRAFTNIADALNEVPAFGAGITPDGGQNTFTVGQNFVDLFGMGTQRTLTLVNGRRFVSSNTPTIFGSAGGLQVDLNAIPVALLERIEVVPLAGSAVYGSDAIAGVVNVILRDDYEGFEVSGQFGVTEEGDGETYQIQSTFGTNFGDDRGNIVFSVEYNKQEGMLQTDRPYFTDENPDFLNVGGGVQQIIDGGQRVQLLTGGGAIAQLGSFFAPSVGIGALPDGNFYQFADNGNLDACEPGRHEGGSIFFAYGGTCGVDFFDQVGQLRSPVERLIATSMAHYQINDYIRYNQEFMFANTKATELVNQGGFQSFPFGGTSSFATIQADNPFLNDQARGILAANGMDSFSLNRFNNDLVGAGENSTENFTWRYAGGFEGEFEFADREFFWDVTAVFGQADVETRTNAIIDGRFVNAIEAVRLSEASLAGLTAITSDLDGDGDIDTDDALLDFQNNSATGVSGAQLGDIVCQVSIDTAQGTLAGEDLPSSGGGLTDGDLPFSDGCVPLNLFGEGAASAEALAFINGGPAITSSDIGQRVFSANFGGDIADLPGGAVAFAVGFENRREIADFTPGLGTSIAITRSSPFDPTRGKASTSEFYGEMLIPLVSEDMDIPFLKFAEVEGSVRRVKNTITDPSDVSSSAVNYTYELGGRFSPVDDITFRATYASAIRSPSLVELFSPQVQAFISGADPCDNREIDSGPAPATRRANCAAAGITDPESFTSNIQNATIIGAAGGNPALIAERSKAYSIGVVLEPRWIPRLTVTADYLNIKIEDRIENFDFEALAETCYDSTDFPNVACGAFERDPTTGQVIDVLESFLNAANSKFEAIQFVVNYDFDLAGALSLANKSWDGSDFGRVDLNFNILHRIDERLQVVPTRPADVSVGDFGDPNVQATFDMAWEKGPFRWFYRINYQDSPLLDATGEDTFFDGDEQFFTTRARFIHNTSLSYRIFDRTTVQLSVDNLFNRRPDRIELAANRFDVTEQLGRRFTFRVRSTF